MGQPGIPAFWAVPITKVLCIMSFIIATAPGSMTRPRPPQAGRRAAPRPALGDLGAVALVLRHRRRGGVDDPAQAPGGGAAVDHLAVRGLHLADRIGNDPDAAVAAGRGGAP